jgi:hypothetical protein
MKFDILQTIETIRKNPQPQLVTDQIELTRKEVAALGHDITNISDETIIATNIKGSGLIEYFVEQQVDISQFNLLELGQLTIIFLHAKEIFAQQQTQNARDSLANMLGEQGAQELTQFFQDRGKVLKQL